MPINPELAETLHKVLCTNNHELPINEYTSGSVKSVTGYEFDLNARKIATIITQRQFTQKPVIVLLEGGVTFLSVLVAGIYAGMTLAPCPIPTKLQDYKRLARIIDDTVFHVAIVHEKDKDRLAKHLHGMSITTVESLVSDAVDVAPLVLFKAPVDNIAIIQYSSGSTANPKGVLISPEMILANHTKVQNRWHFTAESRHLCWLPHYHDMGLFGGLLYPLLSSGWLMIMASHEFIKRPSVWLNLISKYKVNVSGGPPFAFELSVRYLRDSLASQLDLSCWSVAFCGADYVPASLKSDVMAKFARCGFSAEAFFACYGLAETVLFAGGEKLPSEPVPTDLAQVFNDYTMKTLPCYLGEKHTDIGIFSLQNSKMLSDGEEGEICLAGDATAMGYSSGKLPAIEYQQRRWIRTGDVGIIKNHYLTVTGRLKDIIKLRGKTLYPIDFSVLASSLFAELNPHAFLLQMEAGSDILRFSIETYSKQISVEPNTIIQALKVAFSDAFGVFVSHIKIYPRNSLPRTTSGKIQRWTNN
jgi:acyl-CoA synthetase (AMP-forming)/AMP-acid ligase II